MNQEKLEIRKATQEDAALIKLRASDLEEALVWAPSLTPQEALRQSIEHSTEAFTGTAGGEIVGIWGYRVAGGLVHPWLMCSDLIKDHSLEFLQLSREAIQKLRSDHAGQRICNYVYGSNSEAKRLLTFLGFEWIAVPSLPAFDFFYLPPNVS